MAASLRNPIANMEKNTAGGCSPSRGAISLGGEKKGVGPYDSSSRPGKRITKGGRKGGDSGWDGKGKLGGL